eukprot:UN29563
MNDDAVIDEVLKKYSNIATSGDGSDIDTMSPHKSYTIKTQQVLISPLKTKYQISSGSSLERHLLVPKHHDETTQSLANKPEQCSINNLLNDSSFQFQGHNQFSHLHNNSAKGNCGSGKENLSPLLQHLSPTLNPNNISPLLKPVKKDVPPFNSPLINSQPSTNGFNLSKAHNIHKKISNRPPNMDVNSSGFADSFAGGELDFDNINISPAYLPKRSSFSNSQNSGRSVKFDNQGNKSILGRSIGMNRQPRVPSIQQDPRLTFYEDEHGTSAQFTASKKTLGLSQSHPISIPSEARPRNSIELENTLSNNTISTQSRNHMSSIDTQDLLNPPLSSNKFSLGTVGSNTTGYHTSIATEDLVGRDLIDSMELNKMIEQVEMLNKQPLANLGSINNDNRVSIGSTQNLIN